MAPRRPRRPIRRGLRSRPSSRGERHRLPVRSCCTKPPDPVDVCHRRGGGWLSSPSLKGDSCRGSGRSREVVVAEPGTNNPGDPLRRQLLWVAEDFRQIIDTAPARELDAPTRGTRWTNRQLLFHMVLGQNIALTSIPLIGAFSRLPPGASREWSRRLQAFTGPYNWVNWAARGRARLHGACPSPRPGTPTFPTGWTAGTSSNGRPSTTGTSAPSSPCPTSQGEVLAPARLRPTARRPGPGAD